MRVAACDDEKVFREEIKTFVYAYSDLHRLEIVLDEFRCGEDLLKSKYEYAIIFLDYKMDGINGLETAKKLRERNIDSAIIFLTNYPHIINRTFEVDTYRFFEKPLQETEINRALDDYFRKQRKNKPIIIKTGHDASCVQSNDIVYLEADNKKCYIHLINEKHHVSKTMATVEKLLPSNDFVKVHKAFIVNMCHIRSYDKEYVYFKNGDRAYLSRNYTVAFKDAYRIFAKNMIL